MGARSGRVTWDRSLFSQGSTTSLSTIETPTQPSSYLSLIQPVPQPPVTPYSTEGGHFYTSAPPVFRGLDVRPRLGSNSSTTSRGMAHAHRSTTLPHPGAHLSVRDVYTSATPAFRRPDHHIQRSPSFSGIRRHNPLSPTSTPAAYGSVKMDTGYSGTKTQPSIPPLVSMTSLGHLSYADASATPIKVDISGVIDKGFFVADGEWTCYRRNYFSCVCSFSLAPMLHNTPIHFQPTGSTQAYSVYGFAMCISAVVSDNDSHTIELVQHTPKRDKGPIAKPEKQRLSPKPPQATHHPLSSLYAGPDGSLASSRYEQGGFGQPQQSSAPTEYTFERIQFKQATANNGKRRAAQQYYHLIVELWADVGQQGGSDPWVKVAYRKSAKMIVRGRSPGHYQSERRGSTSSGPGGSGGGSIGGGVYSTGMLGPGEYAPSSSMMGGGGYGQHYDSRSGGYGGTRHHHEQLTMDGMMSAEEVKAITDTKAYQYYPATLYEGEQDPRHHQQVELFSHPRHDVTASGATNSMSAVFDPTKVKSEMENGLPSLFYHGGPYYSQRCGRFEGKATSNGQYPTLIPPPSTMSMT
ncbi:p53-like transcription factor [Parathielavia appendiculata]|uniref:P53-like transcription factor n=1 Tax=Parathielavia appendiculata TaxID=2587402 RepID=A0AAN6U3T5_9PEZI|nr:p53-like transcription factor [Parathielavia appendiculata]